MVRKSFDIHVKFYIYIESEARLTFLDIFTENVAIDLETFCNHAGRTTVTTDDVLLLARKNPDLHGIMKAYVDGMKADKEAAAGSSSRTGGAKKNKTKK